MLVIKFVILGLIVWICSYIGNIKGDSFTKRYIELKKFKNGLGIFKSKLEFTYEPVDEIFTDISNIVYEGNDNVFKRFVQNKDWNLAVEGQNYFNYEDKEVAKGLGKMLGKLDKNGQISEICLVDNFLDKQIENAYEIQQKNKKLYKTLGISTGVAIAIVLI